MLKIGDFSKLSRISIRMLRHYDEIGLLAPSATDDFTGYRFYAEHQLAVAGRITALRDMGFGLHAIAELLARYDDPRALANFLAVRRAETQAEADEAQRRLLLLTTAIERLRKDETAMQYNVTKKTLPARTVASVRQVIPAYDQEGMLWRILCEETATLKLQDTDPSYTLAIFHDAEHKEADVDVEVQKSVKGHYPDTAHVRFQTVPAQEIASVTHSGSYDKLTEINAAVAQWVVDNGFTFAGPALCIYHVSPHETQNPDEFVTEVCYPIGK